MNRFFSRLQKPVQRQGASPYLLITLLSFAASVTLTRIFLELTGYPQLGGGGLHIAHILWGGLLLFIAALIPLIFANRWIYILEAVLAGVGVGLFIDEVGKFITQNNNYFFPGAAPIIYAFFLITVLLYTQIRHTVSRNPRAELYHILDAMQEVLDHDLDAAERLDLETRLQYVAQNANHPDLERLALQLLDFVHDEKLYLAQPQPSLWDRIGKQAQALEKRYLNQPNLRAIIVLGVALAGGISVSNLVRLVFFGITPGSLTFTLAHLLPSSDLSSHSAIYWFIARLSLDGAIGLLLLVADGLILFRNERYGTTLAYFGLLLSLTAVNLLVFFYDQFSTIVTALIQLCVFICVITYRSRFLPTAPKVKTKETKKA